MYNKLSAQHVTTRIKISQKQTSFKNNNRQMIFLAKENAKCKSIVSFRCAEG